MVMIRTIIDPHIHLWDQLGTPRKTSKVVRLFGWSPRLLQNIVKFAFPRDLVSFFGGSMDVVSDYLPFHYRSDVQAAPYQLATMVHIQADWQGRGPMAAVGETAWLEGLEGGPGGIVGFVDMTCGNAVDKALQAHQEASPRFRGVRQMLAHHPNKAVHSFADQSSLSHTPSFLTGFEQLARRKLSFDAWCYHHQINDVRTLALAYPETTIILCHLGTPVGVGGPFAGLGIKAEERKTIFKHWAEDIARLAECPNVIAKISGLAMPVLGWGFHLQRSPPSVDQVAERIAPLVEHALLVFGAERCMFASNFPIDRVSMPYHVLYGAYEQICAKLSDKLQHLLFFENAARVYHLDAAL